MRLLIVEDNGQLRDSLKRSLEADGYAVDAVGDGMEGLVRGESGAYDVIVLDLLLPGRDGREVCRELRRQKVTTPILMLTALDAVDDRVTGLDCGADDYLVKPFALAELRARLRALLRREAPVKTGVLTVADLTLEPATHTVMRAGRQIDLTAKEYALLEYMMRNPNRLITREMAECRLWNDETEVFSNVVDVYIRRLRRKIDEPFPVKLIETVRGYGYRLQDPAAE